MEEVEEVEVGEVPGIQKVLGMQEVEKVEEKVEVVEVVEVPEIQKVLGMQEVWEIQEAEGMWEERREM